jgi:hypothetical protein
VSSPYSPPAASINIMHVMVIILFIVYSSSLIGFYFSHNGLLHYRIYLTVTLIICKSLYFQTIKTLRESLNFFLQMVEVRKS